MTPTTLRRQDGTVDVYQMERYTGQNIDSNNETLVIVNRSNTVVGGRILELWVVADSWKDSERITGVSEILRYLSHQDMPWDNVYIPRYDETIYYAFYL